MSRWYTGSSSSSSRDIHEKGIVHRDIKPENILIERVENGIPIVRIADFGLCYEMKKKSERLRTPCGSALYAAPEIINRRPYDGKKCDIWSLGVVLFAMATGCLPWDDDVSQDKIVNQISRGAYRVPARVPRLLKDLVMQMMNADETKRLPLNEIKVHEWMNQMQRNEDPEETRSVLALSRTVHRITRTQLAPLTRKATLVRPQVNHASPMQQLLTKPQFQPKRNSCPGMERPQETRGSIIAPPLGPIPEDITASMAVLPVYNPQAFMEGRRHSCT